MALLSSVSCFTYMCFFGRKYIHPFPSPGNIQFIPYIFTSNLTSSWSPSTTLWFPCESSDCLLWFLLWFSARPINIVWSLSSPRTTGMWLTGGVLLMPLCALSIAFARFPSWNRSPLTSVEWVVWWINEWMCLTQPTPAGIRSVALVLYHHLVTTSTPVKLAPICILILKVLLLPRPH